MAWESRKGTSRRYYTRSRKVDGRVYREYVGRGARAEEIAHLDALRRGACELARLEARRAHEEHDAFYARLFGPLDVLEAAGSALMRQTLAAAGYRQHDRGEWRKVRRKQA